MIAQSLFARRKLVLLLGPWLILLVPRVGHANPPAIEPIAVGRARFLMTREIAHFQQFSAALATIEPNFPPGILQGDLRFTHAYYNMSNGEEDARGPWNKGKGPWPKGEEWEYIDDPTEQVKETAGQKEKQPAGHERNPKEVAKLERDLAAQRSAEMKEATPKGELHW